MFKNWTKETYAEYQKYLLSLQDLKYKEFNERIIETKYEQIGIRLPQLRKIAKEISKSNIEDYLKLCKSKYYEEVLIEGIVIANLKDEKLFDKYFPKYIKKVDSWSINDTLCTKINVIEKNPTKYFPIIKEFSIDSEEFTSRVGLITILKHFIKKEYLEDIFNILNTIKSDKYYCNMAEAWLVCEIYIHYPKETTKFLKNNKLNAFTQNKSISKIRDSYRVTKEEKDFLNTLKK